MDGGYRETELMAKAGASFVVVMGRAHEATVRYAVDAGRAFGIQVMGDNMLADDCVANARWLASLGVDVVIHHIGYDERRLVKGLSPLDELAAVVAAVDVPVQAVGGLSIAQAIACPSYGAPLVVLGAPLVIAANDFKPSGSDLGSILREICSEIRKTPMAPRASALDRGLIEIMGTTQAAVVQYALEPLSVELREIPVPEIGEHDVLLQVGAVSVCGSDVHQFHATHSWAVNVPVVLGHEFCGTVARAGRAVRGVKEGDRVVSETAAVICGTCLMCRTGRYNLCPTRKGFGYGVNGAMASYVATPARCLHAIPDTLPFEYACLCEPHAVAYQSMCVNSTIHPGDLVVVFGPGPIGLLCTRMAALAGANPLVVAGLPQDAPRLEAARALGATHTIDVSTGGLDDLVRSLDPLGADLVCEASGASRPLDAALKLVKPGGQVTKVGWSPDTIPIDINPLVGKNVTLQGSFSHNFPVWERVIHLLATGMAKPEIVVGLRSGLAGWRRAFDAMHDGDVIKSVLLPSM